MNIFRKTIGAALLAVMVSMLAGCYAYVHDDDYYHHRYGYYHNDYPRYSYYDPHYYDHRW